MIERIKYNVFVFFARIRTKKLIKKLEQNLQDYSWHIGVEKMIIQNLLENMRRQGHNSLLPKPH
jgi:hypothetical protein